MAKLSRSGAISGIPAWIFLCFASISWAGRPLVVDDARTVVEGNWEVEFGLAGARSPKGAHEIDLPVMALSYGLLRRLDIGLTLQRLSFDGPGQSPVRGFDNLHIASKLNFLDEATLPAFSFAVDLKLPTASRANGLSSGKVDGNFLLIATKHFYPLAIDGNLGYTAVQNPPGEKLQDRLFGGLALRYGLSDRWRLVGDVYGQSRESKGAKNEANFQIGLRFRPDLPLFFDAAIGRSLLPSGARIQGTLGLTWSQAPRF